MNRRVLAIFLCVMVLLSSFSAVSFTAISEPLNDFDSFDFFDGFMLEDTEADEEFENKEMIEEEFIEEELINEEFVENEANESVNMQEGKPVETEVVETEEATEAIPAEEVIAEENADTAEEVAAEEISADEASAETSVVEEIAEMPEVVEADELVAKDVTEQNEETPVLISKEIPEEEEQEVDEPEIIIKVAKGDSLYYGSMLKSQGMSIKRYATANKAIATISGKGVVKAIKTGETKVCAQLTNGTIVDATIIVGKAISKVKLYADHTTLGVGESVTLVKQVVPDNEVVTSLKYSSANKKVATVNSAGVVTAKKKGTAKITATSYNKKKKTITITVKKAPTAVDMSISDTIGIGQAITVKPVFASGQGGGVTFSSSDPAVIDITPNGVMTAVGYGAAVITMQTYNGVVAQRTVTVLGAPSAISVNYDSLKIAKGDKPVIDVYVNDGASCGDSYDFSSANSKKVKINDEGVVTGVKAGSTTITVTTYNGLTVTIPVTITEEISKIKLSTTASTIAVGQTTQMSVATTPSGITTNCTWSSSNKSVAVVDANGIVTGLNAGTATITAKTYNGKKATIKIKVIEAPVVVEPTAEPTSEPTVEPTAEPTVEPTVEPTAEPTVEPTTEPTVEVSSEQNEEYAAEPTEESAVATETSDDQLGESAEDMGDKLEAESEVTNAEEATEETPAEAETVEDRVDVVESDETATGDAEEITEIDGEEETAVSDDAEESEEPVVTKSAEVTFPDYVLVNSMATVNVEAEGFEGGYTVMINDQVVSTEDGEIAYKFTEGGEQEVTVVVTDGMNEVSQSYIVNVASSFEADRFECTLNEDGKCVILEYTGTDSEVVIPTTLADHGQSYMVTEIGAEAFEGTHITSIDVPDTVVKIGSRAFADCENLAEVK